MALHFGSVKHGEEIPQDVSEFVVRRRVRG